MTRILLALFNLPIKVLVITYVFILNLFNRDLSDKMKEIADKELEDNPEQDLEINMHE